MLSNSQKPILCLLLTVACALFYSCRPTPQYPTALMTADSLTQSDADSAVRLLQELAPTLEQASDPVRRYHQLLTIKAQDKAYIPHTSDSLILDVLKHYESGGDPAILPEAYYYAGRVYRDLGDSPEALNYFHKALESITKLTTDQPVSDKILSLQGKVYSQMGYLFRNQRLYDEALLSFQNTYLVDSLCKDSAGMYYSLFDLGQTYHSLSRFHKAIEYFRQSKNIALGIKDSIKYNKAFLYEIISISSDNKKYSQKDIADLIASYGRAMPVSLLANLYSITEQKDSAYHYYNILQSSGTLSQKAQAKIWLANHALQQKDAETSITLLKEHIVLKNEASQFQNTEAIKNAQALYNYNLREKANHQMQLQIYQDEITAIYHRIAIVLLISALVIIAVLLKKSKNNASKQKRRLQRLFMMKENYEATLEQNKIKIAQLIDKEREQSQKNETLKKELCNLQSLNSLANLSESFDSRWRVTEESTLINKHVQDEKPLTSEEWTIIENRVRLMDPMFLYRLQSAYDFSDNEWKTSILIRLRVSPTNIALLLSRTVTAISNIRHRLYYKVTKQKGTASDWDKFILKL